MFFLWFRCDLFYFPIRGFLPGFLGFGFSIVSTRIDWGEPAAVLTADRGSECCFGFLLWIYGVIMCLDWLLLLEFISCFTDLCMSSLPVCYCINSRLQSKCKPVLFRFLVYFSLVSFGACFDNNSWIQVHVWTQWFLNEWMPMFGITIIRQNKAVSAFLAWFMVSFCACFDITSWTSIQVSLNFNKFVFYYYF